MVAKQKELRPYDSAILHHMRDGAVYLRDELMKVGCAAIDPHYALTMYQKANASTLASRFDGMNNEERLDEIERQRYEGAKLQVSKRLSHLEDMGLIEVMEWADPMLGRKRRRRVSFRITDKGTARINGASPEEIDATWVDEARAALVKVAKEKEEFSVEDIWTAPLGKPLSTSFHSPLEPILSWAMRQGFILYTDKTARRSGSGNEVRVYESLIVGKEELPILRCGACGIEVDPMEVGTSRIIICNMAVSPGRGSRSGIPNDPFGYESTGEYWCVDCTERLRKHSKELSRRQRDVGTARQMVRNEMRALRATRV